MRGARRRKMDRCRFGFNGGTVWLRLFVVLIFVFEIAATQEIKADDLRLLESYQLRQLRDFVQGRGHGSVSKAVLDWGQNGNSDSDSDSDFDWGDAVAATPDPNDPDVVMLGGQFGMNGIPQMPSVADMAKGMAEMRRTLPPGTQLIMPHFITPSTTTVRPRRRGKKPTKTLPRHTLPPTLPSTSTEEPSDIDFEELARIFQKYRDSQSSKSSSAPSTTPNPVVTTAPAPSTTRSSLRRLGLPTIREETMPEFQEFVVSPLNEKWQGLATKLPSAFSAKSEATVTATPTRTRVSGSLEATAGSFVNEINVHPSRLRTGPPPREPGAEEQLVAISEADWELRMREISRKLGHYLMAVKRKKELEGVLARGSYQVKGVPQLRTQQGRPRIVSESISQSSSGTSRNAFRHRSEPRAFVTILREGFVHQDGQQFNLVASITLIRDAGKVILVDTGLATDINGRTDLIQKLSKLNIAPPMVDFVVTTHGHPDHAGNTNDFPDSVHFQGNFVHHRTKFNVSDLASNLSMPLTANVELLRTPGHTSEDVSVLVHNTDKYGTIAIAGDTFMSERDQDFPLTWRRLAWSETAQEESRRELLCRADFVVPGHGKVFKVTTTLKHGLRCDKSRNKS